MLNFCDFIQVYVFTRNHHLNYCSVLTVKSSLFLSHIGLHTENLQKAALLITQSIFPNLSTVV